MPHSLASINKYQTGQCCDVLLVRAILTWGADGKPPAITVEDSGTAKRQKKEGGKAKVGTEKNELTEEEKRQQMRERTAN